MASARSASSIGSSKGEQRLQALTATAGELFLERGFESVSIDHLIERAGGSRRNVYGHFGGKEGLFIEAITQLCTELAAPLESLGIADKDPEKALAEFGQELLRAVLQPRTLALHRLMVAEGLRFPELAQAVWHSGHLKAIGILSTWIETHRGRSTAGICSQQSADVLAQHFVDMVVNGVQLKALVGLEAAPLAPARARAIVDEAVQTFLHGVRNHSPESP